MSPTNQQTRTMNMSPREITNALRQEFKRRGMGKGYRKEYQVDDRPHTRTGPIEPIHQATDLLETGNVLVAFIYHHTRPDADLKARLEFWVGQDRIWCREDHIRRADLTAENLIHGARAGASDVAEFSAAEYVYLIDALLPHGAPEPHVRGHTFSGPEEGVAAAWGDTSEDWWGSGMVQVYVRKRPGTPSETGHCTVEVVEGDGETTGRSVERYATAPEPSEVAVLIREIIG